MEYIDDLTPEKLPKVRYTEEIGETLNKQVLKKELELKIPPYELMKQQLQHLIDREEENPSKIILLTGEPRAGKTTYAEFITHILTASGVDENNIFIMPLADALKEDLLNTIDKKKYPEITSIEALNKHKDTIVEGRPTVRQLLVDLATKRKKEEGEDYYTSCVFKKFKNKSIKSSYGQSWLIVPDIKDKSEYMFFKNKALRFSLRLTAGRVENQGDLTSSVVNSYQAGLVEEEGIELIPLNTKSYDTNWLLENFDYDEMWVKHSIEEVFKLLKTLRIP